MTDAPPMAVLSLSEAKEAMRAAAVPVSETERRVAAIPAGTEVSPGDLVDFWPGH